MCGIGGYVGNFDRSLLSTMNRVMAHRGPDDEGIWCSSEQRVGLGHRRLAIIDLSPLGHQPMWDITRRVAIVFNGEIYNYKELRIDLEQRGYAFASQTDTEVLLNLYLAEGEDMLVRLNGMFAFALWDSEKQQLFIARDGFGVKPLYYAFTDRGFVFASEMKALLKEPSIPRRVDAQSVLNYITYLWCPAPRTMLSAVKKMRPGQAMIVKQGYLQRSWQFYDLPYADRKFSGSSGEGAEVLRDKLAESVRRQMVSDVPVGAFLSGGLDSSAIAYFAREHAKGGKLDCFTIAFADDAWRHEGMDEDLPYARQVANKLDLDLHVIEVGPEMAREFERMVFQLDEPQADPAALNVKFISRLARESGIKVLLSGTGGDDILSGYRRHKALVLERLWLWLPQIGLNLARNITGKISVVHPDVRRLARLFSNITQDDVQRVAHYFDWVDPLRRNSLISSRLRVELRDGMGENPLIDTLQGLANGMPLLDKMLYLEAKHFLADHNLGYTDKMSMAESVEVRVPFLDRDMVSFATSLPPNYKQRGREGKWLFKKAMEPILPRDIIYRSKTGFGAPLRHWLRNELKPLVGEFLSDDVIRRRGLFDAAGVRRFLREDAEGRVDGAYTILAMMCVEMWCREFAVET